MMRFIVPTILLWISITFALDSLDFLDIDKKKLNQIDQVEEIVCDSRVASTTFKCNLEFQKIKFKIDIEKSKCETVLRSIESSCQTPDRICNLANAKGKLWSIQRLKEIDDYRKSARKYVSVACLKAFNEIKKDCPENNIQLPPKVIKYLKWTPETMKTTPCITKLPTMTIETTKTTTTTTQKPTMKKINIAKNINIQDILDFIMGEGYKNLKKIAPTTKKPPTIKKCDIKPELQLIVSYIFGKAQHKIDNNTLSWFMDCLMKKIKSQKTIQDTAIPQPVPVIIQTSDIRKLTAIPPKTPKPIKEPDLKKLIKFIFNNTELIKNKDVIEFIDEILGESFKLILPKFTTTTEKPKTKPATIKPKVPQRTIVIKPVPKPVPFQFIIDYIFGKTPPKLRNLELAMFIDKVYGLSQLQLKPIVDIQMSKVAGLGNGKQSVLLGHQKFKRPGTKTLITFIFGEKQKKINKQQLTAFVNKVFCVVCRQKGLFLNGLKRFVLPQQHTEVLGQTKIDLLIDYIFERMRHKIEHHYQVHGSSQENNIPSIINYLLGRYKHKVERQNILSVLSQPAQQANLQTILNDMSSGFKFRPTHGLLVQQQQLLQPEQQDDFSLSFIYKLIQTLMKKRRLNGITVQVKNDTSTNGEETSTKIELPDKSKILSFYKIFEDQYANSNQSNATLMQLPDKTKLLAYHELLKQNFDKITIPKIWDINRLISFYNLFNAKDNENDKLAEVDDETQTTLNPNTSTGKIKKPKVKKPKVKKPKVKKPKMKKTKGKKSKITTAKSAEKNSGAGTKTTIKNTKGSSSKTTVKVIKVTKTTMAKKVNKSTAKPVKKP